MWILDRAVFDRLSARFERLYGKSAVPRLLSRFELLVLRYGLEHLTRHPIDDWDQRDAVLITYGDMVSREDEPPLRTLHRFVEQHLGDAISTVHVLPFFPFSSDDGFAVIDYRRVNKRLGSWREIRALGERYRLMVDLVINHVSAKSNWFRNYSNGLAPERDFFIEISPDMDLSQVVRPRPQPLERPVQTPYGERLVWATFSHDQIDLNFRNPDVLFEFLDLLLFYVQQGARVIRLDAIAYLWKEPGTDCIHRPQTHEIVRLLRDVLELLAPQVRLLTETNVPHAENIRYFGDGQEAHMVYQFSLPPLLLHALETGDGRYLQRWAAELTPPPPGCTYFNFTASHDGVGVRPLEGLLPEEELEAFIAAMQHKGGQVSYRAKPDGTQAPYEINISYFDALGFPGQPGSNLGVARFLCSQILMMSLQGIPGFYFNSLIGAPNWLAGFEQTGQPRTLNRRKWNEQELEGLLADPHRPANRILPELVRLLRLRALQPAFHPDGGQQVLPLPPQFFGFWRWAPDRNQRILVLANLSPEPQEIATASFGEDFGRANWHELIQHWDAAGETLGELRLTPYQVLWLSASQ